MTTFVLPNLLLMALLSVSLYGCGYIHYQKETTKWLISKSKINELKKKITDEGFMLVEKEGLTHGRSITNNYIKELKGNKAGTYHRLLINLSLKETEERSGFSIVCKGKGHSTEINQEIVYLKNVFYTKLLEISDEKISLGVQ